MSLDQSRLALIVLLDDMWKPEWVRANWPGVQTIINDWWIAYKQWEAGDTFHKAFMEDRMTVRTFAADFNAQKSKSIPSYDFSIPDNRFFKDGNYTAMSSSDRRNHGDVMHKTDERTKYHADRGIDSSAFASPDNFASRESKYQMGLHDLSASLLNHKSTIFAQVHHQSDGAHFSFFPLSMEDDQEVLFKLIKRARECRDTLPQLYEQVRGFRAAMTRVKLAQDSDMGVGFIAVPIKGAQPGPEQGPMFKVRYGLGANTTPTPDKDAPPPDENKKPSVGVKVTPEIYKERQEAARKFKEILHTEYAKANLDSAKGGSKNEIVIALRQHAGEFPVYAVRKGNTLECYYIAHGLLVPSGKQISANGVMT